MPRIQQLPTLVINQIAAGEVIERPASVVKELLENSVDAGATCIEIDVEQGGADLIRIVDDGCGIAPEDLPLALSSHATSKLSSADDLFSIGTFGFRGEALASIGGVAHVVLQSRPHDLSSGACVECKGSELTAVRPWNGSPGTRIEVRQLFFNTPVRRKFLRTAATEIGHIGETVTRLALAHARTGDKPGLRLVLRHNGRVVHDIPASATLLDRVRHFFGPEIAARLYEIPHTGGPVALSGLIADPESDRGNARTQYLFVNGRWIRDRSLGHAIQEAYRGLLMTGRYAIAYLFLTMPPDAVDVNVHPTKSEVRFRNAQGLHHLIFTSLRTRLRQANLAPRLQAPPPAFEPTPSYVPVPTIPLPARPPLSIVPRAEEPMAPRPPAETISLPPITSLFHAAARAESRSLQLYDAYLVVETDEGMLVIDQHALHERILFEQFRNRIASGTLQSQALLIPEPIDLPGESAGRLLEQRGALADLGMGIEDFGGGTVLLTRYPLLLGRRSPREALLAIVEHLANQDRVPAREVLFDHLLSLMACHSAVRAGDRLGPEMVSELLAQRHLADDHHHCPHGRPTALLFTKHDLERQFRRA
jgi:DNA mismatch repair protein MutL